MSDPELTVCACESAGPAFVRAGQAPAVRDLALRRRRSKFPWVFVVYHADTGQSGCCGPGAGDMATKAPEGGDVFVDGTNRCRF